jgi:antibiotic biosynthesis monooxygenase (ABM) superfamily enzyme
MIAGGMLAAALMTGSAMAANKPKTVIHVINVKFKPDASKADIDKAIAAIETVAGKYKGIKNVWLNPITVQGGASKFTHCLVMEFESVDALKKYTDSPEQKEWYKVWIPVRELSNTHDVTN